MLIIKGLDRKGFKTMVAITYNTFRMKAEDQPIIVTPELEEILANSIKKNVKGLSCRGEIQ